MLKYEVMSYIIPYSYCVYVCVFTYIYISTYLVGFGMKNV